MATLTFKLPSVKSDELADLAKAQWTCIRQLERRYSERKIPNSMNLFKDMEWRDERIPQFCVQWGSIDPNGDRSALVLVLKIAALEYQKSKQAALNTINGYLCSLLGFLEQILEDKLILQGYPGDYLTGIHEIVTDDLIPLIDQKIVMGADVSKFTVPLSLLRNLPRNSVDDLFFLLPTFEYPWKESTFGRWLQKRHALLNEPTFAVKPYLAIPPQTTQPIIERSMWIIEKYSSAILKANNEALAMNLDSYVPYLNSEAGVKFAVIMNDIIRASSSSGIDFSGVKSLQVSTFNTIVNLLRAACINVILLTTGLRNFDLTFLRVGCCAPSGRTDMLYYVNAYIHKTSIYLRLPVPQQTYDAITILEKLRCGNESIYVLAAFGNFSQRLQEVDEARVHGDSVNRWLKRFAKWFDIPFRTTYGDDEYTAHCYRATVAGWLDSASNLSILLIRRLFGHGSNLTPLAYLHHNPIFQEARKDALQEAAGEIAKKMSDAASIGRLSGRRGEELVRGYEVHHSFHKSASEALTDSELLTSFEERIKERILTGSMLAMMTPFGVLCTRNPHDSSPPPCAIRAERDNAKKYAIDKELWRYMQAVPNPSQCVGKRCEHAMLGPWSTALRDSFYWYTGFLEARVGQPLATDELLSQAQAFVTQYAADIEKLFPIKIGSE